MSRAISMFLGAPLLAAASLAGGDAAAAGACIPPREASALGEIARRGADTPVGIHAAQRYLDALNKLGSAGETSCYDDMARDVPIFVGLYCKDGKEKVYTEECGLLERIQVDILRLRAERRVKQGDSEVAEGFDGSAAYEAGATIYLQIWEQHGRAACEARSPPCLRMEENLYNAARAFQAARLIDRAVATRELLIDPRYHLDNTELARRALHELGSIHHALGSYEEAASWYESFARRSPAMSGAPEALSDALVFRLALGQAAQAEADAGDFNKLYGSKRPADAAKIAFAVAMDSSDRGDSAGARRRFEAAMPMIDRSASIDLQIRAHAGLGRALAALGKGPLAAAEYGKARALFRDPAQAMARLDALDEAAKSRALGAALTALGEATFFFAEEKRLAADAIPLPLYKGSGRHEDLIAYARGPLGTWLGQRRQAIDAAERAYLEILAIEPAPPPRWVVAAAAQVARMHGKLAAQLRSAPLPKEWKPRGPSPWGQTWEEIRGGWVQALEEASEPELARAKSAYRKCVELSVKLQATDQRSRGCAAWLSSHYPAEYPALDEIIDRPSHRAFTIESPPAPARRPR